MELEKIYQAIITGRAMLITGSGAHMTALGMNGEKFPSGVALAERLYKCLGRMGHLEDSEWRAGADNGGHRERHYDGAVHRCAHVDIRRKDRKRPEEDIVG